MPEEATAMSTENSEMTHMVYPDALMQLRVTELCLNEALTSENGVRRG